MLQSSTCLEQYYAHLQEGQIVCIQHMVSSLSVSGRGGRAVRWLRETTTATHRE